MNLDRCHAVITGASAGIGRELALALAARAERLVLVARRRDRLEELQAELRAKNPVLAVEIRVVDLSALAETKKLAEEIAKEPIDMMINNAGLGDRGDFASADPTRIAEQVQVNILALTLLSRAVLPRMLARQRGAILNVSSSASFLPIPTLAVYAATKAYVTSFSEAIRAETRGKGISVCSLCPGPVKTEFGFVADRNNQDREMGAAFVYVPANEVALAALNAIERDQALVIPGLVMKIGMAITRMMPLAVLRAFSGLTAKKI